MNEPDTPNPLHEFATWAPLLSAAWRGVPAVLAGRVEHRQEQTFATVSAVDGRSAPQTRTIGPEVLAEDEIILEARVDADGRAELDVIEHGPAFRDLTRGWPGHLLLLLIDGAEPEPRRRTPVPAAVGPSPRADAALLERTLRARLGDFTGGADEARLAAAEARLGIALPAELRTLMALVDHPFTAGPDPSWDEIEAHMKIERHAEDAVGCELFGLDGLFLATADTRPGPWPFAAASTVGTAPDKAVQPLVGSPGWIAFGSNGGDTYAVDLTPGPEGNLGQVILLDHELELGADLVADSLTDFVLGRRHPEAHTPNDGPPHLARATNQAQLDRAARPELQVLHLQGQSLSLAALRGLPRLRTITALNGSLANPAELRHLDALEYLELDPDHWRTLLAADALPPALLAAGIYLSRDDDPVPAEAVARELLARYGRPQRRKTRLAGELFPQ
ncbi:SMI1/KNR4 family protein [Kitasatospora sp. NPDC056181]|uniref:SMI1/KNR4 family protein n=1 Tax=Kitasatospora sp. NPDC056181 TaxID=3345737 RepID=UPI0035DF8340